MPANPPPLPHLPISDILGQLQQSLADRHELVLEAPPGAGKTTLVPLALLNEPWLAGQRIIMLEPRRMAARAAAQRMASLLNEPVGHTVGYRVRQETCVSQHTRIEVITEGILTRMLLQDPALEGVGLLIFDEFHERSMNGDFGLALALQSRELFRDADQPLRLLVMSATLDGAAIAELLGKDPQTPAAIIRSEGKMFDVDVIYGKPKRYDDNIVDIVIDALTHICADHNGSLLVFLPGQAEINRVMRGLKSRLSEAEIQRSIILPLYGALSIRDQQRAIEPLTATEDSRLRKIVLATDIAETSLTIAGITVVVDTGLCREPHFDPATGMTRLHTRRLSKDSSIQRMGRAGRLTAGHCYRLWSAEQQGQLAAQSTPEILQADLTPLVLQLLAWGIDDIRELKWLDLPPPGPLGQALDLLASLGAIHKSGDSERPPQMQLQSQSQPQLQGWRLTPHGQMMATMPTHPRLAHMLISSAPYQQVDMAAALAALLADRSPLTRDYSGSDLSPQLAVVMGQQPCPGQHKNWLRRTQQQAKVFKKLVAPQGKRQTLSPQNALGFLLACAYPDRIAHRKPGSTNHYLLSNGRTATLNQHDSLGNSEWLAIAELGGHMNNGSKSSNDRIFSASDFDPELLKHQLKDLTLDSDSLQWDEKSQRFIAEHLLSVGKLIISRQRIETIPPEAKRAALVELLKKRGLNLLPWDKSTRQWQARVMLLHSLNDSSRHSEQQPPWPDVSDQQLEHTLQQWLAPYLDPISKLSDFQKLDLPTILNHLLPWPLPQQLKELAPVSIRVPSGSNISIDYSQSPPVLRVKLQEMFGCQTTPCIANGNIQLMLQLLSPAQRPLQVTQDLAGFWNSSYFEVKKDMKGRYPKHPWPDDPLQALPTKYTKRRKYS